MDRAELSQLLREWRSQVPSSKGQGPRLISETDPRKFMAAFAEAVDGESEVFLCDPNWSLAEKAQVEDLLKSKIEHPKAEIDRGWLMIPTGGSSGQIKFARHDQDTMAAAVVGFCRHFGLAGVDAVGVLPLHHVSGFMAWMRCALTGGEYRPLDWKAVEQGALPVLPPKPDGWVLSLVPTQLERLLRQPTAVAWLAGFRIVFLGGAPTGGDLLDRASAARIPLAPGYGMTETAAMVAALRPAEFLAGARSSGLTLPHAHVLVAGDGSIRVAGDSLFRGYYPELRTEVAFETTDGGWFDERGHLIVAGRRDGIIITGGEKVNPTEVEAVLTETGGLGQVVVVGVPDPEWGQIVVAAHPAANRVDPAKLAQLADRLAPAKRPKRFVALADWPMTTAGKVNRAEVARLVAAQLRR